MVDADHLLEQLQDSTFLQKLDVWKLQKLHYRLDNLSSSLDDYVEILAPEQKLNVLANTIVSAKSEVENNLKNKIEVQSVADRIRDDLYAARLVSLSSCGRFFSAVSQICIRKFSDADQSYAAWRYEQDAAKLMKFLNKCQDKAEDMSIVAFGDEQPDSTAQAVFLLRQEGDEVAPPNSPNLSEYSDLGSGDEADYDTSSLQSGNNSLSSYIEVDSNVSVQSDDQSDNQIESDDDLLGFGFL